MKILLNKKFTIVLVAVVLFTSIINAQSKIGDMKWKNQFMQHMHSSKNSGSQPQQLRSRKVHA
jgi:hypothetical protein